MARVLIQETMVSPENPLAEKEFRRMQDIAAAASGQHKLVHVPENADVILFVGAETSDMRAIRKSKTYLEHQGSCFVFYAGDHVYPFLPGFYPSIERRCHQDTWTRSVPYLRVVNEPKNTGDDVEREYLFSFRGNVSTSPLRHRIMQLNSNCDAKIVDTGAASYSSDNKNRYLADLQKSHFVLCPRGGGSSSFRIFECMRLGRVPVVISDQWVEPNGPDWSKFCIRVAQRSVHQIPEILAAQKSASVEMGNQARIAWDTYFHRTRFFDHLIEQCLQMKASWAHSDGERPRWLSRVLLNPRYFRRFIISPYLARRGASK